MNTVKNSREYKRKLNDILRTNMILTTAICQEDFPRMQLSTILLKHQIGETLEWMGEKNNLKEDESY